MQKALKRLTSALFATHRVEQHALFRLLDADRLTPEEAQAVGLEIFHIALRVVRTPAKVASLRSALDASPKRPETYPCP